MLLVDNTKRPSFANGITSFCDTMIGDLKLIIKKPSRVVSCVVKICSISTTIETNSSSVHFNPIRFQRTILLSHE